MFVGQWKMVWEKKPDGVYWGFPYKGKKSRCKGDLFSVLY